MTDLHEADLDQCRQILAADMTLDGPLQAPTQPLQPAALCLYGAIQELRQLRASHHALLVALRQYGQHTDACDLSLYKLMYHGAPPEPPTQVNFGNRNYREVHCTCLFSAALQLAEEGR